MSTHQVGLNLRVSFAFLSRTYPGDGNPEADARDHLNERWCTGCHNRVTLSPDGQRVYGCEPDCEHTRARCGEVLADGQ
jgi:hypothetical protein